MAAMTPERELRVLIDDVCVAMRRDVGRSLGAMGLRRTDWAVLRFLDQAREAQTEVDVNAIAAASEMGPGETRDTLSLLGDRGLIRRDGYRSWILTALGQRLIAPLNELEDAVAVQATSGLTSAELEQLLGLLRRLSDN
jgi:DNA-binding MarR family transcriptional regulator